MPTPTRPAPLTAAILLALVPLWPPAAQTPTDGETDPVALSNQLQAVIEETQAQLADLEGRLGPYDPALQAPLQTLVDALIAAGAWEEAGDVLARRLQLLRTESGPDTPDQLPILDQLIENDLRQGAWDRVTRHFEFAHWIVTRDDGATLEARLDAGRTLAQWHLVALSADAPRRRLQHFLDARRVTDDLVRQAEQAYGEDSPQLVPWLYAQALNHARLYAFVNAGDELGFDTLEEMRRGFILERDYLRAALNAVKRIGDLLATTDDAEAQAMALLYEADFQTIAQLGTAAGSYRKAAAALAATGIEAAAIDELMAMPVPLPIDRFHSRFSDLWAHQTRDVLPPSQWHPDAETPSRHLGTFTAWNESLLYLSMPTAPAAAASLTPVYGEVELQFNLNSRGEASAPEVLAASPNDMRLRRDARDAVRGMVFRPSRVDGRAQRVRDVLLRFRVPWPDA